MDKKTFFLGLFAVFSVFLYCGTAMAQTSDKMDGNNSRRASSKDYDVHYGDRIFPVKKMLPVTKFGAVRKLARGIINSGFCPIEMWTAIEKENSDRGPFRAVTVGILKGVVNVVRRALTGVYDTATFLFPIPSGYDPIMDPEYVITFK